MGVVSICDGRPDLGVWRVILFARSLAQTSGPYHTQLLTKGRSIPVNVGVIKFRYGDDIVVCKGAISSTSKMAEAVRTVLVDRIFVANDADCGRRGVRRHGGGKRAGRQLCAEEEEEERSADELLYRELYHAV